MHTQQRQFQQSPPFLLSARRKACTAIQRTRLECDPAIGVSAGPCPSLLCQDGEPEQPNPAWLLHTDSSDGSQGSTGEWGDTRSTEGTGAYLTIPEARRYQGKSRYHCCTSCFVRASEGILITPDPLCCLTAPGGKDSGNRRTHLLPSGQFEDGGFVFSFCSDISLTCHSPTWVSCAEPD